MQENNYGLPSNPATTTEMYFHAVVMELQALNLSVAQLVAALNQAQPVVTAEPVAELDTIDLIEPEPQRKGRKAKV